MHVLIIGAGIGGLSLAQSLRKQNISYEIFERDLAPNTRFQGWALVIHSIIKNLLEVFPSDMPDIRETTAHLNPLNLPSQITIYPPGREERWGYQDTPPKFDFLRAERGRLRTWLGHNIPVQWNKRVVRIEDDDTGVTIHFEDGGSARGDILVASDGINSIVRQHLLGRPASDLLKVVPLSTVVGELELSGEAFKRQLALGHSGYMIIRPDLGFAAFGGLHYVHPDGQSARFFWNFMQDDADVASPHHWHRHASQQQKLDYVQKHIQGLSPRFREIFEVSRAEHVKPEMHVWLDLELDKLVGGLPAGRVVLMGDAAHAMTPFRGEGGFNTLIDMLCLRKVLVGLREGDKFRDLEVVRKVVAEYNEVMIQRGCHAVRASRDLHSDAPRFGPDGKPVDYTMRPLPDVEIVLGVPQPAVDELA